MLFMGLATLAPPIYPLIRFYIVTIMYVENCIQLYYVYVVDKLEVKIQFNSTIGDIDQNPLKIGLQSESNENEVNKDRIWSNILVKSKLTCGETNPSHVENHTHCISSIPNMGHK